MASMFPYNNYDRALRKIFQPDLVDDFFTTPLATVMSDAAFKMDVEDTGTAYVVTAELLYLKDASTSGLSARLENGILTVNVPKQDEKANVTKISID